MIPDKTHSIKEMKMEQGLDIIMIQSGQHKHHSPLNTLNATATATKSLNQPIPNTPMAV